MRIYGLILTLMLMISMPGQGGDFENIYAALYLGEAYPSGNAYLHPFQQNSAVDYNYPSAVSIITAQAVVSDGIRVHEASLKEVYRYNPETGEGMQVLIPGKEGMDGRMSFCGQNVEYTQNPDYQYAALPDFFDVWADTCYQFNHIARYQYDAKGNKAYLILAHDQTLQLNNIKLSSSVQRPLTPAEQQEVDAEIKTIKELEKDGECYTENRTLADAEVLLQAQINQTPLMLRLSFYEDPGCMGHMANYYIIDLLDQRGEVVMSRSIYVMVGVI